MIEYIQGGFLLSIYKTFIALLMSFAMLISNGITALLPGTPPEPKSEAELMAMADIFDEYELSDEIYVVRGGLSRDENTAIQSLQGLVSRDKATIFLITVTAQQKNLQNLRMQVIKFSVPMKTVQTGTLKVLLPVFLNT